MTRTPSLLTAAALGVVVSLSIAQAACQKGSAEASAEEPAAESQPSSAEAAPAAPAPSAEARIGQPAPDFTLRDLSGTEVSLSSFRGKTVVLEWYNPGCPFVVQQHEGGPLKDMPAAHVAAGGVWLAINSSAEGKQGHGIETNKASAESWGITYPILIDADGAVGKAYKARTTPHMYVIDPGGVLRYAGAIDNAPRGVVPEEGFVNHVEDALKALAAGQPVAVPETRAYGCSVKYAD